MRNRVLPAIIPVLLLVSSLGCMEKIEPGTTPPDRSTPIEVAVLAVRKTVQPVVYETETNGSIVEF